MSKIQDVVWGMVEENQSFSQIAKELSICDSAQSAAQREYREKKNAYGKKLRDVVARKARNIIKRHSQNWWVDVDCAPLHDYRLGGTTPMVTVIWNGRHGKIELKCHATTPEMVEQFLERFELIVMAAEKHTQRTQLT